MSRSLWSALPFLTGGRKTSTKQYPLDRLFALRFGGEPAFGVGPARPVASLPAPSGNPSVQVKADQILVWISVGFRNKKRSDGVFPAILDPGCNYTLVVSEWHLDSWARSASYDPDNCRIMNLVQETVASTPAHVTPRTANLTPYLGRPLRDFRAVWRQNKMQDWLAIVETDIWLAANEPGERDEVNGDDAWYRLQIPGVLVRHGTAARPPLLGLRALREGRLILPDGTATPLEKLQIDLPASVVHLSHV